MFKFGEVWFHEGSEKVDRVKHFEKNALSRGIYSGFTGDKVTIQV